MILLDFVLSSVHIYFFFCFKRRIKIIILSFFLSTLPDYRIIILAITLTF